MQDKVHTVHRHQAESTTSPPDSPFPTNPLSSQFGTKRLFVCCCCALIGNVSRNSDLGNLRKAGPTWECDDRQNCRSVRRDCALTTRYVNTAASLSCMDGLHNLFPFLPSTAAAYYRLRGVDSVCLLLRHWRGACGTTGWTLEPTGRLERAHFDLFVQREDCADINRTKLVSMTSDAVASCSLSKGLTTDAARSCLVVAARVRVIPPIPFELHGKLHFLSTTNEHIHPPTMYRPPNNVTLSRTVYSTITILFPKRTASSSRYLSQTGLPVHKFSKNLTRSPSI